MMGFLKGIEMMGFLKGIEEGERLRKLEQELKPAIMRGEKKCIKCGFCCHKRTCIPTPEELKKIAGFLKIAPKELINKFFTIDKQSFGTDYYVKPLGENIKDLAGKFIPFERTFNEGKCIFLEKNNLCKIHSVKPKSAKIQNCWEEKKEDYNAIDFWKGNILKKEFKIEVKEE